MIQNSPGPRNPAYRPSRNTTARSHCLATFGDSMASSPTTRPMINPSGLPLVRASDSSPRAKGPRKTSSETMFSRGALGEGMLLLVVVRLVISAMIVFLLCCALCGDAAPAPEVINHLVERKAMRQRLGEKTVREPAQLLLAVNFPGKTAPPDHVVVGTHESADAATRLQHPGALQFGVNLRDGVGVNA